MNRKESGVRGHVRDHFQIVGGRWSCTKCCTSRQHRVWREAHWGPELPAPLERSQVPWCFGYSSNVGCSVVLLCLVAGARSLDSSDGHRQTIIKIAEACCAFLWSTRGNEIARQLGARRGWWWRVGTPSARCTHEKLLATLPLESKTFMHWTWPKKTCMSVRTPPKDETSFHRWWDEDGDHKGAQWYSSRSF